MSDTPLLNLPLIQPSQAQKHVTVNEALLRLDGIVQLRLVSLTQSTPPGTISEGAAYFVPAGATDAWLGHEGQIALGQNGGWSFIAPQEGWRAWVLERNCEARWAMGAWQVGQYVGSPNAGASRFMVEEFDHVVTPGASNATLQGLPANAMVFAVSARVIAPLTGTATAWEMGTDDNDSRFGSGMGVGAGSYCHGILSSPTTVYSAQNIKISALGGTFTGGQMRVVLHYYVIDIPQV